MVSRQLIVACVAAGGLAAVLAYAHRDAEGVASPPEKRAEIIATSGQGLWFVPTSGPATTGAMPMSRPVSSDRLQVTAGSDLIIDKNLLAIMNFYLVQQEKSNGLARLKEDLHSRLTGRSFDQAMQIADRYQRYVREHDLFLAAQNFSDAAAMPDLWRLRIWIEQRRLLRERILGNELAQAWYGEDDVRISQVLMELEQRSGPRGSVEKQAPSIGSVDPRTFVDADIQQSEALRHSQFVREMIQGTLLKVGQAGP